MTSITSNVSLNTTRQSPTRKRNTPSSPFNALTFWAKLAGSTAYWLIFARINYDVFRGHRAKTLNACLEYVTFRAEYDMVKVQIQ